MHFVTINRPILALICVAFVQQLISKSIWERFSPFCLQLMKLAYWMTTVRPLVLRVLQASYYSTVSCICTVSSPAMGSGARVPLDVQQYHF